MDIDFVNIGLAFIEGFALIISPCILPILPIILTGSLTGSKSRPIGIITGFIISFTLITLFSKFIIELAHINPDVLRNFSYAILIALGVVMMSTRLTEKFSMFSQRFMNIGSNLKSANNPESGFLGGMLFGGLIGLIWTPCAGPILATVIVQAIAQKTTLNSALIVTSFATGVGLPMLLITLLGRKVVHKFHFFRDKSVFFRRLLGLLIILGVVFAIYSTNLALLYTQPSSKTQQPATSLINGLSNPYPMPPIEGISYWINSPPINPDDLKGKVILIDFWAYSCINCIRTLPYLKDWYAKYKDKGFLIIGVHSPEFQFEHDFSNVKNAVKKYGIRYPVALDNRFTTWKNYHNLFWPAHYLINKEGNVVYQHFGEGAYDVTENNIRYLLGLTTMPTPAAVSKKPPNQRQTPETYLGYARSENFASPESITKNKPASYTYPKRLPKNYWALKGSWTIYPDKIVAASFGSSIKLHFNAKHVYAVMGINGEPVIIKLTQKDNPVTLDKGQDVMNSQVTVNRHRLYDLINLKKGQTGILEITANSPGLEIYTFTFGQ